MVSETPGGRFADALNLLEQIAAEVIARTQPTQAEGDIETLAKFAAAVAERLASLRRAMAQPLVS
jgi:hypothetical protein